MFVCFKSPSLFQDALRVLGNEFSEKAQAQLRNKNKLKCILKPPKVSTSSKFISEGKISQLAPEHT